MLQHPASVGVGVPATESPGMKGLYPALLGRQLRTVFGSRRTWCSSLAQLRRLLKEQYHVAPSCLSFGAIRQSKIAGINVTVSTKSLR